MAEVFGVVTGGLGVLSLAVQIASSLKTLKDSLDVVKETPAEVKMALDELEVLSLVLKDVDQSVQDQAVSSPIVRSAIEKAVKLCKASCDALDVVVNDIQAMISSKKKWAAVKGALKRDKLTRVQVQLERAKGLLVLANQCYYK